MSKNASPRLDFNAALLLMVADIGDRAILSVARAVRHDLENSPPTNVFGCSGPPNAWLELCRDIRSLNSNDAGEAWRRELRYRLLLRIRLLFEDERQCATFAAVQRDGAVFRDLIEPFRADESVVVREALRVLLEWC